MTQFLRLVKYRELYLVLPMYSTDIRSFRGIDIRHSHVLLNYYRAETILKYGK